MKQEIFDRWWGASKYCQVVIPGRGWRRVALDGFNAGHDAGYRLGFDAAREAAAKVAMDYPITANQLNVAGKAAALSIARAVAAIPLPGGEK